MKSSRRKSKKLILKNLSKKSRKILKNQALKKIRSSRDEENIIVKSNHKTYHIEMTIKFLHFCVKFLIINSKFSLSMTKFSIKSIKSIINTNLTRVFCDIVKNITKNKI